MIKQSPNPISNAKTTNSGICALFGSMYWGSWGACVCSMLIQFWGKGRLDFYCNWIILLQLCFFLCFFSCNCVLKKFDNLSRVCVYKLVLKVNLLSTVLSFFHNSYSLTSN